MRTARQVHQVTTARQTTLWKSSSERLLYTYIYIYIQYIYIYTYIHTIVYIYIYIYTYVYIYIYYCVYIYIEREREIMYSSASCPRRGGPPPLRAGQRPGSGSGRARSLHGGLTTLSPTILSKRLGLQTETLNSPLWQDTYLTDSRVFLKL